MARTVRRKLFCLFLLLPVLLQAPLSGADAGGVLTLPAGLSVLPEEAFCGDTSLDAVVIPEGVTAIGARAFAESSLKEITLPASLTAIAEDAFSNAPLKTIHTEKGSYAYTWMRDHGYIAEYRALLIGQQRYLWFEDESDPDSSYYLDDTDQRNVADVRNLKSTLSRTIGPRGAYGPAGSGFAVTVKTNLSYTGVRNAIRKAFADTRDQDLSIFFIATHGENTGDGELRMAFTGNETDAAQVRSYWQRRQLSFSDLAAWLSAYVRGRVFVILESCGAGSSIYAEGVEENARLIRRAETAADADAFVSRAVDAFSAKDTGLSLPPAGEDGGLLSKSTGDLRLPRFYVLAASRHRELSYGWETGDPDTSYNFFTHWLIEGIGRKNQSPADTDGNRILSLRELFTYVSQYDSITYAGRKYYQHVQCYPKNNAAGLLKLNK